MGPAGWAASRGGLGLVRVGPARRWGCVRVLCVSVLHVVWGEGVREGERGQVGQEGGQVAAWDRVEGGER